MKHVKFLWICLVIGTACLTGCTANQETFTGKNYSAEAEAITGVTIDVRDRQIDVTLSSDNQIHIDYFENSKEFYDISVSDDHVLTMTAVNQKEWTDYVGGKPDAAGRIISLQLPDAHVASLNLATTNETISLPALTVSSELSLSSHGGDLIFNKLNVGNAINLTAKNGDISGTIIGTQDDYTILCDIKKGQSNLLSSKGDGAKKLTASNNNGDINIEFVRE